MHGSKRDPDRRWPCIKRVRNRPTPVIHGIIRVISIDCKIFGDYIEKKEMQTLHNFDSFLDVTNV